MGWTINAKGKSGSFEERPSQYGHVFSSYVPNVDYLGLGKVALSGTLNPFNYIRNGQKELRLELMCGLKTVEGHSANPWLRITMADVQTPTQLTNTLVTEIELFGGARFLVDPALALNLFPANDPKYDPYIKILPGYNQLSDGTWGNTPYLQMLCKLGSETNALGKLPAWAWPLQAATTTTTTTTTPLLTTTIPSPDSLLRECSEALAALQAEIINYRNQATDFDTLKKKLGDLELELAKLTIALKDKSALLTACEQGKIGNDEVKVKLESQVAELSAKLAACTAENGKLLDELTKAKLIGGNVTELGIEIEKLKILLTQAEDALQLCRDARDRDTKRIRDLESLLNNTTLERDNALTDRKALALAMEKIGNPPSVTVEPMTINVPAEVFFKNTLPVDIRDTTRTPTECKPGIIEWVKENPAKSIGIGAGALALIALLRR